MAALLPTLTRMAALQKQCAAGLPSMFEACEVLHFEAGQLVLSAPNAALATKLKQQLPKLQNYLLSENWQVNGIRIKVQVKRKVEPKPYVKQCSLSNQAVNAFNVLENTLENTPQNAGLIAALHNLVKRHQSET